MRKFGFAFAETFIEDRRKQRFLFSRMVTFYILGIGLIALLWGRLIQLQVVQGKENRLRSEQNRVGIRRIAAPRGAIFDRNGMVLTRNVPVYKKLEARNSKFEIISKEEAEGARKRGEEVIETVGREYLYSEVTAHIIGFVGEVSEEAVGRYGYRLGDLVGKQGIEKVYERDLKGVDGGVVIERGSKGQILRELHQQSAVPGKEVRLTIDLGLQRKVTETLKGRKGAVVVSEPNGGEVLALVSSPGFDPARVAEVLDDLDKPMFNRALSGLYPPGSVFKLVTAVAGLEEGVVTAATEIEDVGELKVGSYRYGNWYFDQYGRTEGRVNMLKALKRSNDIYFYKLGESLGADKLAKWANKFGLGKLVGLGLAGEARGVVPSPEWKEKVKGERWFLGNTYHYAIGQGDLQVTPLQVHQMASVIASDGRLCKPKLVAGDDQCEDLQISRETLNIVKQGMIAACGPGGTAFPFFNFEPQVACKTGTAQFGDPAGRTHAWLVVFGPSQDPEILVTVLLEAAGEGSYQAGPVAKEILEYWFHERT